MYVLRTPYFEATMAPNGMMQVWSGLLLRMNNEAQLAAIMAHEIGHYLQRHSLERLRDAKARTAFCAATLALGAHGLVGQLIALGGAYAFSRQQEREADQVSIQLMRRTGHDPREAAKVWTNLIDELKANAAADPTHDSVLFATHPPSDERRQALQRLGADGGGRIEAAAYRTQLAPLRLELLEDEIRRGRFDESLLLLNRLLSEDPGQADLLYARGEVRRLRDAAGDDAPAAAGIQAAIATGQAPVQTYRAAGTLYRSSGQADVAREAWERYLQAAPQAPDAALIRQSLEEMK